MGDEEPLDDKNRLLFGAGFVFGVMFTLLILAIVTVTLAGNLGWGLLARDVIVTIFAGILFTSILGTALYLLAFPENRIDVPVEAVFGTDEGNEER
ncbi:MAG: hypothetical protein ACI8XM_001280 [Haloarculaceae archaeon]|jgi:hypothetical protein